MHVLRMHACVGTLLQGQLSASLTRVLALGPFVLMASCHGKHTLPWQTCAASSLRSGGAHRHSSVFAVCVSSTILAKCISWTTSYPRCVRLIDAV